MSYNHHKAMDWYSWLSKTSLEPSLVYDYGLSFTHNELEEEDIAYFNHEFLQSMGISIAKHRLEILKLVKKERRPISRLRPMSKILIAIKQTKKCLVKYIQTLVHREDSALVLVPRRSYSSSRWKDAMLKRNSKPKVAAKQGRLLLTNGSPTTRVNSFSSPMVYDLRNDEKMEEEDDEEDDGYNYYRTGVEEIRWDTMFQNLKPT